MVKKEDDSQSVSTDAGLEAAARRLSAALDALDSKTTTLLHKMKDARNAGDVDEDRARLAAELDAAQARAEAMEVAVREAGSALDLAITEVRSALGEV